MALAGSFLRRGIGGSPDASPSRFRGDELKNKLSKYLQPMDFTSSVEKGIGYIDLSGALPDPSRNKEKLFLRNFSAADLYEIMKRVKLIDHLQMRGLTDIRVEIDIDDAYIHYLKLYHQDINPDSILFDLRLSESRFVPDSRFFDDDSTTAYDMIVIEWLSAQNPFHTFSESRPQLPGQKQPGLGILNYCFEMMYIVAREVIKDGFLDIPDHVHGAVMYSKKFKFFDPAHEGALRAMMRDLHRYSLADISWGIITRTIIEEYKCEPQPYEPSEQVFPVSDRMRRYFNSKKYLSVYNKYYKRKRFRFEHEEMVKRRQKILESKSIVEI
ncbi:MAG: hypothetical protein A2176_10640 [Spirochaetes bacterium RBG_13_51_14]|nr:MAG: hypothetical protein A2176_10640 [Spirochaetes bacterium RBG_13_51_14]